ncbi:hypothetical protein PC129_g2143 [Phytophthora cactorum]|uniref:Uncharacterized protein n=1 Tax=Phytophthora cactorum TaxID=29920 RepID=A0A8T1IQF7_9STRA|nr:hypothetical protein Pcac1_g13574 [Phytophthora cactorum]KAG2924842.1 hypothetical protein PC114_g4355 [Phytophthora cactorum]KAG2938879.1 hypothetical protein PC115_g3535 [Phytophthora cactorum]KAG3099440.1 hypothetical protein PC122_g3579 [Phytophthora cactorum]KAG3227334.1 hypothetical protein PC129_g2143 [Phytophthora cactorum]
MQPNSTSELQADVAVADLSSPAPSSASTGLSSWPELKQLNAAVTVTPLDSDAQQRNRKRQRPSALLSPSAGNTLASFSTPGDLKLDFAGFEVGSNAPSAVMASAPLSLTTTSSGMTYPAASNGYSASNSYSPAVSTDDVFTFLKNLQLAQDSAALSLATQRLAQDGFDSVLALAFAAVSELQHAGIADAQLVWQQTHRDIQARRFQGPGVLSPSYTVSRWMELCGIPKTNTFEYVEYLCRLGYSAVRDLEFILHDQRALAVFKTGHSRLMVHCVQAAISQQQQQQLQVANYQYGTHGPNVYAAGSSSALLQPLDIQRENEFDVQAYDSFLEALIEPTDAERLQQQQRYSASGAMTLGRENDANRVNLMGTADVFGNRMTYGGVASPVPSNMPLRLLPQEHLQLLYEAVNLPRPNPCRRGKKIYWSVLATGGMKEDRFAPLAQFTAAELQNAYLRQFELPASNPVKIDAWSDDNIRQLEHAVKDPRCRHLSKVCWEMLATGRTGVDEYAPLAKFTASQLRSRFRSLFGDKRPQKLRQKKQMLKLQQQLQQEQQANSAAAKNERLV